MSGLGATSSMSSSEYFEYLKSTYVNRENLKFGATFDPVHDLIVKTGGDLKAIAAYLQDNVIPTDLPVSSSSSVAGYPDSSYTSAGTASGSDFNINTDNDFDLDEDIINAGDGVISNIFNPDEESLGEDEDVGVPGFNVNNVDGNLEDGNVEGDNKNNGVGGFFDNLFDNVNDSIDGVDGNNSSPGFDIFNFDDNNRIDNNDGVNGNDNNKVDGDGNPVAPNSGRGFFEDLINRLDPSSPINNSPEGVDGSANPGKPGSFFDNLENLLNGTSNDTNKDSGSGSSNTTPEAGTGDNLTVPADDAEGLSAVGAAFNMPSFGTISDNPFSF